MKRIRLLSCILAALILMSAVPMTSLAANADTTTTGAEIVDDTASNDEKAIAYRDYLAQYGDKTCNASPIMLQPKEELNKENKDDKDSSEDKEDNKEENKEFSLEFTFDVEEEGFYVLSFDYQYDERGNKNTTYKLLLDGQVPYKEVSSMTLSRLWKNHEDIKEDANGDDINPKQDEFGDWRSYTLYDKEGYYDSPLKFYLTKGEDHTLSFAGLTQQVSLKNVVFTPAKALPTYEEYMSKYASAPKYDGTDSTLVQGESAAVKTEMYLIGQNDITNPVTYPYSAKNIKINTFGGANWKLTGETVTWTFKAPKAGLYKLSIRYRQNFYDGVSAHRRLYVNGVVPYEEANKLEFPYDTVWQTYTLQNDNGEDLYVYLNEGENKIDLQVVLGSSAKIAEELNDSVLEMNTIYRDIMMITGSSPDDYRDYNIQEQIPGILDSLTAAKERLEAISDEVAAQYGEKSSLIAKIANITRQLDLMIKKPAQITKSDRLSAFKSNISTIGSWISMFREQPLEIDVIAFYGDNGEAPRAKETFLEGLKHKYDRFVASFTQDYSSMGLSAEGATESINVWIQAGRDQANVLKQLTGEFTNETGVGVELELVTGAIIEATLAGKGPDVALSRANTDPVNFAMRNALYDLSTFGDFKEVEGYFVKNALVPFEYKGGVYGLPETMSYQMMFVRTDIMDELGLEIPTTWEQLIDEIYPVVSRKNMEIGVGNMNQISAMNASNIFTNLLYQMGGQIYNDDLTSTALDSQIAYQAFNKSVEIYADYLFPREYDAMSRFRTGEMPVLLADYTMYNVFAISIPELEGMWEMYPIPGVKQDDGTINNVQAATEVASVMFKGIENPEAGWKFLKWWVGAETQAEFGNRIEAILGAGGRYATANVKAMELLPWSDDQLTQLKAQRDNLVFVEQLPGSYFTSRAINSAFMTSVLNNENPNEQLLYWSEQINLELKRKIEEFAD